MKKICLALATAAIALCAFFFQHKVQAIIDWTNTLGSLAPVFFLMLYCLASILFLPTMVLTLAGGALFGPIAGTVFNLIGATLGAASAFCISRYMVFNWLANIENKRITNLIAGVERQGWQFVALLRLIPILPSNLVNYGLGVTRIKFSHYIITTAIFLIPVEIFFTYCGYAGMSILTHTQSFYKGTGLILLLCLVILVSGHLLLKRHRLKLGTP